MSTRPQLIECFDNPSPPPAYAPDDDDDNDDDCDDRDDNEDEGKDDNDDVYSSVLYHIVSFQLNETAHSVVRHFFVQIQREILFRNHLPA